MKGLHERHHNLSHSLRIDVTADFDLYRNKRIVLEESDARGLQLELGKISAIHVCGPMKRHNDVSWRNDESKSIDL